MAYQSVQGHDLRDGVKCSNMPKVRWVMLNESLKVGTFFETQCILMLK